MIRRLLRILSALSGLLVIVAFIVGFQVQQFLTQPVSDLKESKVVEIHSGSSAAKVAEQLHQAGLLDSPKWFVWYLRYHDQHGLIKTGEMRIQPEWTVEELAQALIKGETVKYPVTLIAGHTFEQTLRQIQGLPKIEHVLADKPTDDLYKAFKLKTLGDDNYPYAGLEGWFLPETYLYQSGDSDLEILARAHQALSATLDEAWKGRSQNLPFKRPYEALIMASLVEKETAVPEERALIAGVFINRLRKGMRLQTDPTVIYGIGAKYDGNIRKADLLKKTPYNTYRINGLPPSPIALPSREAITAVMHPDKTKALYFVAKGNGEHYFSETLIEHNKAVRKYQLQR